MRSVAPGKCLWRTRRPGSSVRLADSEAEVMSTRIIGEPALVFGPPDKCRSAAVGQQERSRTWGSVGRISRRVNIMRTIAFAIVLATQDRSGTLKRLKAADRVAQPLFVDHWLPIQPGAIRKRRVGPS